MSSLEIESLTADYRAYQSGLRSWLEEGHADAWRNAYTLDAHASLKQSGELVSLLFESGWGRFGWPRQAGGLGGNELHLAVLYDELSRLGIAIPEQYTVLQVLGPMVVHHAPHLADRYLEPFLHGKEWWGQGFSESEAGSDLASLRTRAVREGSSYRITGSKLWTSHGYGASRMVVLARTGTTESRHRGLSMFLVDSDSPGLEIRPIALANGREEVAEVFYDDVVIPEERRIGEEGQGWAAAMYLMQYERGLFAWLRSSTLHDELRRLAEDARQANKLSDRARSLFAEAYLDVAVLRARASRTVRRLARGETLGPETSADKLLLGATEVSVMDAAREMLEEEFLLDKDAAQWRDQWWFSRTTTIYGGSSEVQRQILADRVLNLPKEER